MSTDVTYTTDFLAEVAKIAAAVDAAAVDRLVALLADLRTRGGRLFIVGSGGGAGHASHAVNDFRKLCGIEAYTPTDNVSELTARINDDGWESSYVEWLKVSRLGKDDMLLVFSVGGGDTARNLSMNLVRCVEEAKRVGARVGGIVGRDGGATAKFGDAVVIVPNPRAETVTPQTEGFQAVLWHLLVSHPSLAARKATWEARR
ncbi:MAG TPA: SIS domain-containing protein [Candidatus Limnocylindria bacterium]|nr:SIS domain-containing protein [Candidatus Limnocylindria bacterium]